MSLEDYKFSEDFLRVMRRFITKVVDEIRPLPKYAVVQSYDMDERTAVVLYNEIDPEPVPVAMTCIFPSEVGQTVIVDGPPGDRRIVAVIGKMGLLP